jgi:hypothetical protein
VARRAGPPAPGPPPLLPSGSRVELIADSPHNLQGHLDQAIALLLDWFAEHLAAR